MAAAGPSTFRITTSGSVAHLSCSSFPSSSSKPSAHRWKLPLARITCSVSLLASKMPPRQRLDVSRMESAFSSSVFTRREESFDDGEADIFGTNRDTRHFFQAREGDSKGWRGFSALLPWADASLRYANVMWFKGSCNAEIICGENEPEDSIVRRFRRAVNQAGVIRECQRRRYRETRQDTIRRKQQLASYNRRRKPTFDATDAWTVNAWKLSREHLKTVDHSKKKKKPRKYPGRPRFDAKENSATTKKTEDSDDDFWGYPGEGGPWNPSR